MVKKKRPLKRIKPTPPTPGLSAMKAIARSRAAIPAPAEVKPKAKTAAHDLVIAVYMGHRPPAEDFPIDLQAWDNFIAKYGMVLGTANFPQVRALLVSGSPYQFGREGAQAGSIQAPRCAYAVLDKGRAKGDIARAVLMVNKVGGTIQ